MTPVEVTTYTSTVRLSTGHLITCIVEAPSLPSTATDGERRDQDELGQLAQMGAMHSAARISASLLRAQEVPF